MVNPEAGKNEAGIVRQRGAKSNSKTARKKRRARVAARDWGQKRDKSFPHPPLVAAILSAIRSNPGPNRGLGNPPAKGERVPRPASQEKAMITIRKAAERGHANHGWLDSWHSFSFAEYSDPRHVHFGPLRVINEDKIAGGGGFPPHPHRDMEILTYVLSGAISHRDSMGNGSTLRAGDTQRMSAGTGVVHSEFNASKSEGLHLLQIWVIPTQRGGAPEYEESHVAEPAKRGRLALVAAPRGEEGEPGAMHWGADASLRAGLFDGDERASLPLAEGRKAYAHLVRGSLSVNGRRLLAGDAAMIEAEASVEIEGGEGAEVLVFELGELA
jgi:quercetin 2,3-dioxygenase